MCATGHLRRHQLPQSLQWGPGFRFRLCRGCSPLAVHTTPQCVSPQLRNLFDGTLHAKPEARLSSPPANGNHGSNRGVETHPGSPRRPTCLLILSTSLAQDHFVRSSVRGEREMAVEIAQPAKRGPRCFQSIQYYHVRYNKKTPAPDLILFEHICH